jgi:hypothetical protein
VADKHLNLVIAVPSGESIKAEFAMSLVYLTSFLTNTVPGFDTQEFSVHNPRGSILSRSREKSVRYAQERKATHLLFLDSDMTFPKTLVSRMLGADKWVVACNCATKIFPSTPTARIKSKQRKAGLPCFSTPESPTLEKVWRVGTGVMMIDMRVFEKIKSPYFEIRWNQGLDDYTGEDWRFCELLEEKGIARWVDHPLSLEIGHIGSFSYEHDVVQVLPKEQYVDVA